MNDLTITLNPEKLQYIVNMLAACPYKDVAELIPDLVEQARAQAPAPASGDPA